MKGFIFGMLKALKCLDIIYRATYFINMLSKTLNKSFTKLIKTLQSLN